MKAKISSTAKYLPKKTLTNSDLEKMVDTSNEWILSRTGIEKRHIVSDGEATSDMCKEVAIALMEKSGKKPEEIDLILIATSTPDVPVVSTAALVQDKIGATNAWGYDIVAACTGFVYAMETGAKLVESGKYKNVIVIGADTMSSIIDYTDRNTCVIFGDGGGGVILEPTSSKSGIVDSILHMDGSGGEYLIVPGGGSRMPATKKSVDDRAHYIKQDGKTVFKHAVKGMADVSEKILSRNNLTGDDISLFIPHQANKRIIDSAANRCGISEEKVLINIDRYGNTTAGTIPIAINEAINDKRIKDGDYVLLASFGAGF